jgi:transcriptional regulator with XRE-family HTH domain
MATTRRNGNERAKALGAFLKRTRSSRTPERPSDAAPRRRVKGLRREEVALAAGISHTWYTWIEQGRPVSCSRETLHRIASALRMEPAERKHLFDLAADGGEPAAALATEAPAELTPLLDAMRFEPAYVINALWDVLYFNAACAAVLGPFAPRSHRTGNVLRRLFLDETWRRGFDDWEGTARSSVAQFRSATGRLHGVDGFGALVTELADESPEFRVMWERKLLALPPLKRKIFTHATAGRLALHYASLRPQAVADDVTIVLYVPVADSFEAVKQLVSANAR